MEKDTKYGRHPKEISQKQRYQVNVKFATGEYYDLKAKALNAALSVNDFVRMCTKQSTVMQRLTPETNDLIRNLCNMGNNLNQIAKRANQAGYASIRDEYLFLAEKIDTLLNFIRYDCENIDRK